MATSSNRKIGLSISFTVITALLVSNPIKAQSQNVRPIADAGLSRYAGPDPIVLDGTGSYDPDNSGTLSYTWRQISGPSVVIIDANKATPTIAGSIQPGDGRNPTPKPGGLPQTHEVQECQFELVVTDGELESLPDIVKVIIVPEFGENLLELTNDSFDPSKPTIVYFGGGDCTNGTVEYSACPLTNPGWLEKANIIYVPNGYGPDSSGYPLTYYQYGDMLLVYLSAVAPDYKQPIQTSGWSTGGQPAIDAGRYVNLTYKDRRYAINRVTFFDATPFCRDYSESIAAYLDSSVDGEQCWVDNYVSTPGYGDYWYFYDNILNVWFDKATDNSIGGMTRHRHAQEWYNNSLTLDNMTFFNSGVVAGAYWSVVGPGKNLQLASTVGSQTYKFTWYGWNPAGYMDLYSKTNHPGQLPEPVTLVGRVDAGNPNGFVLACEESEDGVGYQLLIGSDPYRVMDYEIVSDTQAPPNEIITEILSDQIWWTVRVRDQYGSTIYADPMCLVAHNPNPSNGAVHSDTWASLGWNEGIRATFYDVYFGESYFKVQDGTPDSFLGNQALTYFTIGLAGSPYPDGLVPGKTYFWRIDDVGTDGTVIHKGKIWRFTVSL
ncbi:MAG: hypothetical protein P8Z79_13940 [Sedimentisphaerales bacterium]